LSAKKRIRQNVKSRERNRARKSRVKTQIRKLTDALGAQDAERAEVELRRTCRELDRVAAKGTLHKNTVARRKSRLQKRLNALTTK